MDRISDAYQGIDDNLRLGLDSLVEDLDSRGYSIYLESVAAGRILDNNPSLWKLRRYPFHLPNLSTIKPKLSEALYCMDVLKKFTLESDSKLKNERLNFLEVIKATPLKYHNKIERIDSRLNEIGQGSDLDETEKREIFLSSRPPYKPRYLSELTNMIIGMNLAVESVFKRNWSKKNMITAHEINKRIDNIVKDAFLNFKLKNLNEIDEIYSKTPKMISELTWALSQKRQADILGIEEPIVETNGYEIADVLYVGPIVAFADFQTEEALKIIQNYMNQIERTYGSLGYACMPELLIKLCKGRLKKNTLGRLEREVQQMKRERENTKLKELEKQKTYIS